MAIAQLRLLSRVRFGHEAAKSPGKIRGDDQDRHY